MWLVQRLESYCIFFSSQVWETTIDSDGGNSHLQRTENCIHLCNHITLLVLYYSCCLLTIMPPIPRVCSLCLLKIMPPMLRACSLHQHPDVFNPPCNRYTKSNSCDQPVITSESTVPRIYIGPNDKLSPTWTMSSVNLSHSRLGIDDLLELRP